MNSSVLRSLVLSLALSCAFHAHAEDAAQSTSNDGPAYGPELQGFDYPYPVAQFALTSQRQVVRMAYMDVHPLHPNGRTAVLLHGKNFCSATWKQTIESLTDAGYRVIAPDQIGFCKSTKPARYQYSFQQLARNTHALLGALGVSKATLIAHSTGGMLAVRYALMYPRETEQLVLVNPIGLEDWKAKGVPSISVDDWYARELKTSADGIRRYEASTYYSGQWRAHYEPWVQMLAGMYRGPGKDVVAWNSALIYDMIYTQPVVYEFDQLKTPTLLRQGFRAAGNSSDARPLSGSREAGEGAHRGREARRVSRTGPRAADAGPGGVPQGAARWPRRREAASSVTQRRSGAHAARSIAGT